MINNAHQSGLQLQSLIGRDGRLALSLVEVPNGQLADNEVLVRVEATPVNPSDLGLLLAGADLSDAREITIGGRPGLTAAIPAAALPGLSARLDQPQPVGLEGAGTVVRAGESASAQALVGKVVAMFGGGMYAQYRRIAGDECIVLDDGATPADGASAFVNPLTALGMVETMRREGHSALVHTAAASNLGQMLNMICVKDSVPLVNIVRNQTQAKILQDIGGATYVCDSSMPEFRNDLTSAIRATGATLAFDAIGGGTLVDTMLKCMEAISNTGSKPYSPYGSTIHKQVYTYGRLSSEPTMLTRNYGSAWGVGGWLLMPFLGRIGEDARKRLQSRVVAELKTTFASRYTKTISLTELLQVETLRASIKKTTGEKLLINPSA